MGSFAANVLILVLWPFAIVTALMFLADLISNNWGFSTRALLLMIAFVAATLALVRLALTDQ
jgi:hypothetical protein